MMSIIELLSTDGYITVNKKLLKMYGAESAILIGELCSEHLYYKNNGKLTKDGYFYSTHNNIENNTGLSKYIQSKALNKLKKAGIIGIKREGMPAKNYYKIFNDKLLKIFTSSSEETCHQEVKKLDLNNNKNNKNNNKNKEYIYTESSPTEITIETKQDNVDIDKKEINSSCIDDNTENKKEKKKNLYDKCIDVVNDYTDNEELRENLKIFVTNMFSVYREMGKVFYTNILKSKLKGLTEIYSTEEERITAVKRTNSSGWCNFYYVNTSNTPYNAKKGVNNRVCDSGVTNTRINDKERIQAKINAEEREKNGEVGYF